MGSKKKGSDFSTLVELLRYRAEHQKDRIAYIFLADGESKEISITYGELDRQAKAIAAELQKRKLSPGDRALLLYPSGLEFISAFFGCLYAAVVAAPIELPIYGNINIGMKKLAGIMANSTPEVIMTSKAILSMVNIEQLTAAFPFLKNASWLESDSIDDSQAANWQEPDITAKSIAFLQYTSGSTSAPKGVINTHENLIYNSWQMQTRTKEGLCLDNEIYPSPFPADPADFTHITWVPLFHDMGLIANIIHCAVLGCLCVVIAPEAFITKPLRWLRSISKYKGVVSWAPNFAYELCIKKAPEAEGLDLDLSSWLIAVNAAEPVRLETIDAFYKAFQKYGLQRDALIVGYGLAEATIGVAGNSWGEQNACLLDKAELTKGKIVSVDKGHPSAYTCVSCGLPVSGIEVAIVNPETSTLCHPDEVGEIWLAGSNICQGYWNDAQSTKEFFNAYIENSGRGPFLRTGDLGFMKNGELFITGRLKDLLIIRGKNHYPQDIELTVAKSHPSFRLGCTASFAIDLDNEERLVVIQEIRSEHLDKFGDKEAAEAITAINKAVLENHELSIHAIVLVKPRTILKTSSGKIQRKACKELFLQGNLKPLAEWKREIQKQTMVEKTDKPIRNNLNLRRAIEDFLITAVAGELAIDPDVIELEKPFTDFGLDSAKIIAIAGKLEDWLQVEVSPTLLFDYPTIAALAKGLSETSKQVGK